MIVLANGCFDVLHIGHKWHLEQARQMGTTLIVGLTVDAHVNKGPGRPVHPFAHREELLRALRFVDGVIPCSSAVEAIEAIRPDIFVKGRDYSLRMLRAEELEACKRLGVKIRFTTTPKMSSTAILGEIRK